jgi:molybdopterin synthase sulfur carrier subunit
MIRVLYFARLREQLGTFGEDLPLDPGLTRVADIAATLRGRGGPWADAFAPDQPVLAAVNQALVRGENPVADGDEVAFFPPVTGG